jgi:hypothetical protein
MRCDCGSTTEGEVMFEAQTISLKQQLRGAWAGLSGGSSFGQANKVEVSRQE